MEAKIDKLLRKKLAGTLKITDDSLFNIVLFKAAIRLFCWNVNNRQGTSRTTRKKNNVQFNFSNFIIIYFYYLNLPDVEGIFKLLGYQGNYFNVARSSIGKFGYLSFHKRKYQITEKGRLLIEEFKKFHTDYYIQVLTGSK